MLYLDDVNYWKEVTEKHSNALAEAIEKQEEMQLTIDVLTMQNKLLQAENKDLKETIDKMHEYIQQGHSDG